MNALIVCLVASIVGPLPGSGADRPADDLQRRGLRRLLGPGCLLPD
ncbi:MAG: hypothetical protein ACLUNZ_07925 [Evtepia sp.]